MCLYTRYSITVLFCFYYYDSLLLLLNLIRVAEATVTEILSEKKTKLKIDYDEQLLLLL